MRIQSAAVAVVAATAVHAAQGEEWWADQVTGCAWGSNAASCEATFGSDWRTIRRSTCWGFRREATCRPPDVAGRRVIAAVADESTARWTGCGVQKCGAGELVLHASPCAAEEETNTLCGRALSRANMHGDWLNQHPNANPTLFDLPMIGTHHAPTGERSSFMCNIVSIGKCQNLKMREQLEAGVRAFGLRVACTKDSFDHYHGGSKPGDITRCLYGSIMDRVRDVNNFLRDHPSELAVLEFQHTDFEDAGSCGPAFLQQFYAALPDVKIITKADTASAWPAVRDLVAANKRLLIVSDNVGIFRSGDAHRMYSDTQGRYANADEVDALKQHARGELESFRRDDYGPRSRLTHSMFFLTPQGALSLWPSSLADRANPEVGVYSELLDITPVSVVWLDFGLEKGSHALLPVLDAHVATRWASLQAQAAPPADLLPQQAQALPSDVLGAAPWQGDDLPVVVGCTVGVVALFAAAIAGVIVSRRRTAAAQQSMPDGLATVNPMHAQEV